METASPSSFHGPHGGRSSGGANLCLAAAGTATIEVQSQREPGTTAILPATVTTTASPPPCAPLSSSSVVVARTPFRSHFCFDVVQEGSATTDLVAPWVPAVRHELPLSLQRELSLSLPFSALAATATLLAGALSSVGVCLCFVGKKGVGGFCCCSSVCVAKLREDEAAASFGGMGCGG
ncbi:uncharacterized protein DS421_4g130750 [Arachis hypogaea]|nr:uncharacterized protein DS421_4g130750 [Arachis hypogaea]